MDNEIKYVNGDLLKLMDMGIFDIVAHGCNCFHTMGAGIAYQLAKKYPRVLEVDCENSAYGSKDKLGGYTLAEVTTDSSYNVIVYNAYTQYRTGGHAVSYDAIWKFCDSMAQRVKLGTRIGLPMIGAGLGGGSWNVIEAIINDTIVKAGHDVSIVIYKP